MQQIIFNVNSRLLLPVFFFPTARNFDFNIIWVSHRTPTAESLQHNQPQLTTSCLHSRFGHPRS